MAYTIFTINDTAWVFSPQKFNSLLEKKKIKESNKNGRRISNTQIYNELSELIHISPDAIKKWKLGKNSFSDETYLGLLAQYFDADKTDLLIPVTNSENKSEIYSFCLILTIIRVKLLSILQNKKMQIWKKYSLLSLIIVFFSIMN